MYKSEKFWDMVAKGFDKDERRFEKAHIKTVENARKYLNINDTVLDFGCATGKKTLEIAGWVKRIHGIDISSKMALSTNLQFNFFLMLSRIGLVPYIKRFKYNELKGLIDNGNLQIVITEHVYHKLSDYFIAAKKI